MDKLALLTQAGDEAFVALQVLYEQEPGIKVPQVVKSYSSAAPPSEVTLAV